MASPTIVPGAILNGPGILYWSPLGSTDPSMTPSSNKFSTAAWGSTWVALGATNNGSEFKYKTDTDNIEVEESYFPVKIVT
ncbi:MAG: hypothetical protein L0Y56_05155, partial [Nitrospira sp.]|nr:hypothetical protein [Nitrospira sp.]